MKHTTTHMYARARSAIAQAVVVCVVVTMMPWSLGIIPVAEAVSSFRPTIFVSTEAFLAIDDDDTTADVVLRFGDTLAKTLSFNRSLDRFEFNDDVYVTGTIQASNTISGAVIFGAKSLRSSGSLVWEGTASGRELRVMGNVGINTASPTAPLHVTGNAPGAANPLVSFEDNVGTTGRLDLSFANGNAAILATSALHLGLNSDTAARVAIASTGNVGIGRNVTSPGSPLAVSGSVIIGNNIGTSTAKTRLEVIGAISGSFIYATQSFSGAGLSDCDTGGTSKLLWDATTGRFSCGTDSSATYTAGQGLSLNGTSFRLNATVTGSVIQAANSLASSGSLSWKATASGQTLNAGGGAVTISASGASFFNTGLKNVDFGVFGTKNNALFYVNATGSGSTAAGSGGIGIGTRTPITQLDVAGAMPMRAQGTVTVSSAPTDVTVHGRYAFITTDTSDSLHIYDVSNPSLPVSVGSIAITGGDPYYVAVQGNYAYVTAYLTNQLRIYDISNPSGPALISSIAVATAGDVAVAGRYAYVLNLGGSVFHVIDIANPAAPVAVSNISTASSPYDLVVQGGYAYVNTLSSMQVIDISDPSAPFVAGSVAANGDGGIAVQGRYVYVTSGINSTVEIIDVKNPATPAIVGTYTDGISAFSDIEIQGRYAYLTVSTTGRLIAINVSNPAVPTFVSSVKTGNSPNAVSIAGRYAYVVNFSGNSLQTFDLGGAYIQQLEVGGLETTSLDVRTSFRAVNGWFEGGLGTQSLYVYGNAAMSGSLKITKGFESGSGNIVFTSTGGAVFNEQSRNVDLRIEGDTDANLFFADASTDRIGIGKNDPRTKLDVVGAISGSFIYATRSFSGAGLSDCDTGGTSKLLWDATTGRFSCGTDSGATYTAGQGLSLNGTAFSLSQSISGTLLEFQTVSGAVVYAERQLSVSGSTILGEDDSDNLLVYGYSTFAADAGFQRNVSIGDSDTRTLLVASNVTFNTTDGPNAFFNVRGDNDPNLLYVNPATDSIGMGKNDPRTKLDVVGAISGSFIYATRSFSGAGLSDCDTAGTSKLLWDATTGRFSCGTDSGATYTAGQGLTLTSTSFRVNSTLTGSLARFLTVSGSTIFAKDTLASSGSIILKSTTGNADMFVTSTVAHANGYFDAATGNNAAVRLRENSSTKWSLLTQGTSDNFIIAGDGGMAVDDFVTITQDGNVGIGPGSTMTPKTKFDVVGAISGSFIYATRSFSGAGLSDCDTAGTSKLLWDATTGRFSCGTDQTGGGGWTDDGTDVRLTTSTDYVGIGIADATTKLHVYDAEPYVTIEDSGGNGASLQLKTTDHTWNLSGDGNGDFQVYDATQSLTRFVINDSGNVGIGSPTPKAKLAVFGTISGTTIYATKSFSGAGLSDCDTAGTSKLLWDATTGRFSCGTDQSGSGGNWSNTGSLQTYFDNRYVNTSGDTMTGALVVQNGTVHSATLSALLNVRGTMSGRLLNISGSGASPLLTTTADKPTVRIGGSGSLVIEARSTDPGSAPANTASLFAQKVGGRTMLHQGSGSTFAASPVQNALFGNLIMSLSTGAGTTVNGYGTTVTNDTTVSHPAAGETFGYMTNFATSTTQNDEAGTSSTTTSFFRGSTAGANGFYYYARVGVVDTTSITVFSGMADQTIATMVGADNPAGNHVGFQFSTGRGDTNWMFTTKDNTTQNANSTGLAFTANKVYDLMFTCTKQCASITWEIRNVTDGTSAKGTTSSNLPTTSTALRIVLGVETETTAARNIRMQQIYVEADR